MGEVGRLVSYLPGVYYVSRGEWASLLASERESSARGVQAFARRQRHPVRDDVESKAARAEALVDLGELSAARLAPEFAFLAPWTAVTLPCCRNR